MVEGLATFGAEKVGVDGEEDRDRWKTNQTSHCKLKMRKTDTKWTVMIITRVRR